MEAGKVIKRGEDLFFFFFFFFHFWKRRKLVLGLPKWKFSTGKKHFTPGKKNLEKLLCPSEKYNCYAPGFAMDMNLLLMKTNIYFNVNHCADGWMTLKLYSWYDNGVILKRLYWLPWPWINRPPLRMNGMTENFKWTDRNLKKKSHYMICYSTAVVTQELSFLCSLAVFFLWNLNFKMALIWKKNPAVLDLLFTFLVTRKKTQKILQHISRLHTYMHTYIHTSV